MSKGRKARRAAKALQAAINELLVPDFCGDYHCAGDCGQPHSAEELQEMIRGTKLDHGAAVCMQKPCDFLDSDGNECKATLPR